MGVHYSTAKYIVKNMRQQKPAKNVTEKDEAEEIEKNPSSNAAKET